MGLAIEPMTNAVLRKNCIRDALRTKARKVVLVLVVVMGVVEVMVMVGAEIASVVI